MSERHPQSGPVVVYGATGFTGRLIAERLDQLGADFVIAGRNPDKLATLGRGLDTGPEQAAVSIDDRGGLESLFDGAGAVIACAGPFFLHGEPVLAAAANAGANYLDTTGEQPFIKLALDRYGPLAADNGAAVISGMGFDYAPGDMLAALTADGLGRLDRLTIAYAVRGFEPTRGTAHSAIEMLSGGDIEWVGGAHRAAAATTGRGRFEFPSPIGSRRVGRYPAGEQVTVPRHVEVSTVSTVIDLRGLIGAELGPLGGPLMTLTGKALDGPLGRAAEKLIPKLPEGPTEQGRRAVRFTLVCDVSGPAGSRRGVLRGGDIYGTTAVMMVRAALELARPGYARSGGLAPAEAFDPASFLDGLEPHGLRYEIGVPAGGVAAS